MTMRSRNQKQGSQKYEAFQEEENQQKQQTRKATLWIRNHKLEAQMKLQRWRARTILVEKHNRVN